VLARHARSLIAVLVCVGARSAFGQDLSGVPEVRLHVAGCPAEWANELRDRLRLELSVLGQERSRLVRPELGSFHVHCEGGKIELRVEVGGRSASRQVDLGPEGKPSMLARALALCLAELADGLWNEPRRRPRFERPAPLGRPSSFILLGATMHRVGRPGAWLFGGALGGHLRWSRLFGASSDVRVDVGAVDASRATVHATSASLWLGLLVTSNAGPWHWAVGPGARVGWAWLRGDPSAAGLRGERLDGPWAGPVLSARLLGPARGSRWTGALSGEAGIFTLPLTGRLGTEQELFALRGAWMGITLGVGVAP
jgi:hypothetical protein